MDVIEVNIGHKTFTVKTDESNEHVKKVENIINEQLDVFAVNKRYNEVEKHIFTSFVICDRYVKLMQEIEEIKNKYKLDTQDSKEKIISLYKENEELRRKLEDFFKEKDEISALIDEKESLINDYIIRLTDLEQGANDREQNLVQAELDLEELRKQVGSLNDKCLELSKDREQFLHDISKAENTKNELNSRISKMLNKLNEKDKIIADNELVISQNKKSLNELNQRLNSAKSNSKNSEDSINNLHTENTSLKEEINKLKEKLLEKDDIIGQNYKFIEELKILKEEINKRHDRVNNEKEKYLEEVLIANGDIENLNFTINELNDKLNRKESENFQNEVYIEELKKENNELMKLLDEATSIGKEKK